VGAVRKINVAVLMGGRSAEREVSLSTGRMIMQALDPRKYNAFAVDSARFGELPPGPGMKNLPQRAGDSREEMLPLEHVVRMDGSGAKPDVVFIALHGKFGEDGTVQGLLDLLGIPYVGSGVLASALAMDKVIARKVLIYEGIPVPKAFSIRRPFDMNETEARAADEIGSPAVVKPSRQGSTIGLTIVRQPQELAAAVEVAFTHDRDVLIEEFIEGTEITVPVLGNDDVDVLPIVEIVPASGVYDYYSKYTPGATEEIVPARIPDHLSRRAQELAVACHKTLDCRGMSRTDMIVRDDDIYVLELNTIPGMTPTSLLPRAAEAAGIVFPDLLDRLIGYALERG
jgi:D-alanine-D-alanine ligase